MWQHELLKLNSFTLNSKITVVGERDKHLGPRWEIAKIHLTVEPASKFEVVDRLASEDEARKEGYIDWAVFGLLDILMVAESAPLKNVLVTIEKIEIHAVNSSPMAFRQAGRDAGRKIIELFRKTLYPSPR